MDSEQIKAKIAELGGDDEMDAWNDAAADHIDALVSLLDIDPDNIGGEVEIRNCLDDLAHAVQLALCDTMGDDAPPTDEVAGWIAAGLMGGLNGYNR